MDNTRGIGGAISTSEPFTLVGFPLTSWAYAVRIWLAMVLALLVSFWLQLDNPSSAAITVAILAQPRRGQALQKAGYRAAATIIGVIASIIITAIFAQTRDLFLLATATWLALSVYVASYYDGNRGYGVVLAGYTVSLVTVTQIDTPQNVFVGGLGRGAVVIVGIVAVTLVNDVLGAPDVLAGLRGRLEEARGHALATIDMLVGGKEASPEHAVAILRAITSARLDIQALPSESPSGGRQAAALRSSAAAMIRCIAIARSLSVLSNVVGENLDDLRAALKIDALDDIEGSLDVELDRLDREPARIASRQFALDLIELRRLATREFVNMEEGHAPERKIYLPIHRDRQAAWRNGLRAFIAILVSSAMLVLFGWPMTSLTLSLVGVVAALSATSVNPGAFAKGAVIAMPLAIATAGVTEFLILDGVDTFTLLAIAMAPTIFGACFLSLSPKPSVAGLGFLLLVFFPFILSPANPQDYNPQTFVVISLLAIVAVASLFVALYAIFPTIDKDRSRWMIDEARRDLRVALEGRTGRTPTAASYLGADRIVQLSQLRDGSTTANRWRLRYMVLLSDLTVVATRATGTLRELEAVGFSSLPVLRAQAALARFDTDAMLDAVAGLLAAAPLEHCETRSLVARIVADMFFIAKVAGTQSSKLRHPRIGVLA